MATLLNDPTGLRGSCSGQRGSCSGQRGSCSGQRGSGASGQRGSGAGASGQRGAEKTEVLSEDLLQVEKRLELVKQVSHSTHKKLTACLQGQQGVDVEKRSVRSPSKKLPLTTLAQCLVEGAAVLGDDSLLG
ncbi:rho GTPase-activating protein 44-like [Oncorhynchus nerka]|uniref:rho GTPase-activating protein 44-like n=1 Tax=Oncorhynchus nerka TaxID=8023 RepID=UPI0031B86752